MPIGTREVFKTYTDEETFAKIKEYDSLSEMWKEAVASYGADHIMIKDNGSEYTYADVEKEAAVFRAVLAGKGLSKGDRVGIIAVNSYEAVRAFIAVVTSGMTAVMLPPHLDERTIFGCCMKFSLKAVVFDDSAKDRVGLAGSRFAVINVNETTDGSVEAVSVAAEDEAVIMFTGGTTGSSKGALLTNRALMQGVTNGCYGYKDVFNQRYILLLPLFHVFGLIRNTLTPVMTGSTLWICRNTKDMFKDIAIFRPTVMVAVPAMVEMAYGLSKQFGKQMLGPDMKYIICGAANVPPYLIEEYYKDGILVLAGYGLTETANLVSGNPDSVKAPDSVGKLFPNQEVKLVDGEIWIKGSNIMSGYIGEEENPFEDGWFRTGDLGRFDEEGYLYITGRIKEIIVLPTGENVSPAELEAKFNTVKLIQDSQVFEAITEDGRHILALEVVPRASETAKLPKEEVAETILKELRAVNETIPSAQRVTKMTIRDKDFDRTPSMKIVRYKNAVQS